MTERPVQTQVRILRPVAGRQYAAVDMEARDAAEQFEGRRVHGDIVGQHVQGVPQRLELPVREQQGLEPIRRRQQTSQHQLRLGHEQTVASAQITVPNVSEHLHTGIAGIRHIVGAVHWSPAESSRSRSIICSCARS